MYNFISSALDLLSLDAFSGSLSSFIIIVEPFQNTAKSLTTREGFQLAHDKSTSEPAKEQLKAIIYLIYNTHTPTQIAKSEIR